MQTSADGDWKPKIELARAASLIANDQFAAAIASLETFLQAKPGDDHAPERSHNWPSATQKRSNGTRAQSLRPSVAQWPHRHARRRRCRGERCLAVDDELVGRGSLGRRRSSLGNGDPYAALANERNPQEYIVRGLSGLGWCQLEANEPQKSAATFDRLLENYPDSQAAAEAAWLAARRSNGSNNSMPLWRRIKSSSTATDRTRGISTPSWLPRDCRINCISRLKRSSYIKSF